MEPLREGGAVREALADLMTVYPERWPEVLAGLAGGVCQMDVGALNLLADAAVEVAGMAHRMTQELDEERDPEEN